MGWRSACGGGGGGGGGGGRGRPLVRPVLSTEPIHYHTCKCPLSTKYIDSHIVSDDSQYHFCYLLLHVLLGCNTIGPTCAVDRANPLLLLLGWKCNSCLIAII